MGIVAFSDKSLILRTSVLVVCVFDDMLLLLLLTNASVDNKKECERKGKDTIVAVFVVALGNVGEMVVFDNNL